MKGLDPCPQFEFHGCTFCRELKTHPDRRREKDPKTEPIAEIVLKSPSQIITDIPVFRYQVTVSTPANL
jgi:hypothetical protein